MDSDPKHTASVVYSHLDSLDVSFIHKEDWPGNSPDLNPMENVWAMLSDAMKKNPPSTITQLKRRLQQEWKNLDQNKIANAINSMPARLQAVKAARGGHTDY